MENEETTPSLNYKMIMIFTLSPIPNFMVLYYYIICSQIIINNEAPECESLTYYNLSSIIMLALFNIYLIYQLFIDENNLFFHTSPKSMIYQGILITFLITNLIFGSYYLHTQSECDNYNENAYIVATGNLIVQSTIAILLLTYAIYLVILARKNKTYPVTSIVFLI